MAEFKYLDIDCAAWVMDTKHLTPAARGIYMDLLILAWCSDYCRIANDPVRLAGLLNYGEEYMQILDQVLSEFWTAQRGGKYLIQKRLRKELLAANRRRHISHDMLKARWNKEKKPSRNTLTETETVTDKNLSSLQSPRVTEGSAHKSGCADPPTPPPKKAVHRSPAPEIHINGFPAAPRAINAALLSPTELAAKEAEALAFVDGMSKPNGRAIR